MQYTILFTLTDRTEFEVSDLTVYPFRVQIGGPKFYRQLDLGKLRSLKVISL